MKKDTVSASAVFNTTKTVEKKEEKKDSPPEINLVGGDFIKLNADEQFVEPGYEAKDEEDGDITSSVESNAVQKDNYNYEVDYSVTDSAGNTVTKTRTVRFITGVVCLTFDDGPSHEITPGVLDVLKENNVNATFFVIAFDDSKKDIVKRENDEGNVVALHGYSHEYSQIYTSIDNLMENFYKIGDLVNETIGTTPKIIRFPGGTSNTISKKYCKGIMSEAVKRVTDEGYIYVDWNVDSNDAGKDCNNSDNIYNNVTSELKQGRTNVVLMHDRKEKASTLEALPRIIEYCYSNGYDFQTINENTDISSSQHHPNN